MTIDGFLALERLPTAEEFVAVCGELGIKVVMGANGQPALRVQPGENKQEGVFLAKLMKREPWRTEILAWLRRQNPAEPTMEVKFATEYVEKHRFPEKGWPVGARWWRNIGDEAWQPITEGSNASTPRTGGEDNQTARDSV